MATLGQMLAARRNRKVEKPQELKLSMMVDGERSYIGPVRKGAMNEALACGYLLSQGYDVFRNMSPEGPADIIAVNWETGERLFIDVKSGAFSIGSRDGEETLARAKELGICIMVMMKDGSVEWYNRASDACGGTLAADNDDIIYDSPEDYARRCAA